MELVLSKLYGHQQLAASTNSQSLIVFGHTAANMAIVAQVYLPNPVSALAL